MTELEGSDMKKKVGHLAQRTILVTIRNIQPLCGHISQPGDDGHSDQKAGLSISYYK